MAPKVRCNRCRKMVKRADAFQWLENDELEDLSPKFCRPCYFWVLDHYDAEAGDDIENLPED